MNDAVTLSSLAVGAIASLFACLFAVQRVVANMRHRWLSEQANTEAVRANTRAVSELTTEVRGLNTRVTDHDTRITRLESK